MTSDAHGRNWSSWVFGSALAPTNNNTRARKEKLDDLQGRKAELSQAKLVSDCGWSQHTQRAEDDVLLYVVERGERERMNGMDETRCVSDGHQIGLKPVCLSSWLSSGVLAV